MVPSAIAARVCDSARARVACSVAAAARCTTAPTSTATSRKISKEIRLCGSPITKVCSGGMKK